MRALLKRLAATRGSGTATSSTGNAAERVAVNSRGQRSGAVAESLTALPLALAAVYGGYFGAGLSVILLAVLGLFLDDSLTRLNAVKQAVAFGANFAAGILFLFSGQVVWEVALTMAVAALLGGAIGGRLAGRIRPATLRWVVVILGVVVGLVYLARR